MNTVNETSELPDEVGLAEQEQGGISRRTLIAGGVGIATMLAIGGAAKAFAGEGELLRPPGALCEDDFIGSCIKCDRCRSACPHGAIGVAHIEDGILQARTPKMDFRKGYCDFCEDLPMPKCYLACPTGAILAGFNPSTDKIGVAAIDKDECLLFRSGSGKCSKQCIEACVFDALSLNDIGRLEVNEELCNGCGACEYVCPSASYGSFTGSKHRGINIVVSQ